MIKDILNFINKLTIRKIVNIVKTECSYWISVIIKQPIVWGMPHSFSIEPTSLCNLHCPECPTGKGEILRKNIDIIPELYKSIIGQIADTTTYLMLYLQGEPFLNKSIFDMIQLADQKNIYTCISTNGHFLNEENARKTVESGLDRIIISLDGTTPEVYRKYRVKGNFHEVINGIKNLAEAKQQLKSTTPYIILQFIVFKHNQHQVKDFKMLGKSPGINKTKLKTAQLYDFENGHEMLTDLVSFARYRKAGEKYAVKGKMHNRCKRIWTIGAVTTDGNMTPCCYDKNATYSMGKLSTNSVKDLWKSSSFMKYRFNLLQNRKAIDICSNCTE